MRNDSRFDDVALLHLGNMLNLLLALLLIKLLALLIDLRLICLLTLLALLIGLQLIGLRLVALRLVGLWGVINANELLIFVDYDEILIIQHCSCTE